MGYKSATEYDGGVQESHRQQSKSNSAIKTL